MSKQEQITALYGLLESRKHVFPITYGEIKAIGSEAIQEYARLLIQRANEINKK